MRRLRRLHKCFGSRGELRGKTTFDANSFEICQLHANFFGDDQGEPVHVILPYSPAAAPIVHPIPVNAIREINMGRSVRIEQKAVLVVPYPDRLFEGVQLLLSAVGGSVDEHLHRNSGGLNCSPVKLLKHRR